jgi:hypothetical protein
MNFHLTEYGFHFIWLALLDERVEDDNVLALQKHIRNFFTIRSKAFTYPGQTEEVRIAVRASLRAINLVKMLERELELLRKFVDPALQLAILERGKLIEKWLDDGRVEDNHGQLERDPILKSRQTG